MKNYLKAVRLMFGAEKKLLVKCLIIVLLLFGIETAIPLYMQNMISRIEQRKSIWEFLISLVIFAIIYFALCVVDALRAENYQYIGQHVLWETRKKVYNVLWKSDYIKYVQNEKEKIKFVLSTETYLMFVVTTIYTINLFINFITVVLFLVLSFMISPVVAVVLLIAFMATLLLSFFSGQKILANYEKYDNAKEQDVIINHETVDMVEVVRTNGLIEYYEKRNLDSLTAFTKAAAASEHSEIFWSNIEGAAHGIIYVVIAGILILCNGFDGGQLVTILFITNFLLSSSQQFQRQLQVIIKNIPVFDKVMEIVDTPIENGTIYEEIEHIAFDKVSLKYENDREIFRDLSFEINKGDKVILEGENGSGKSTVLKMLVGMLIPTGGEIRLNGKDMNEFDRTNLYKEICYVSQDELLLNEKVEEYLKNVVHAPVGSELIKSLRKQIHLNPEITSISENGRLLSGGEKKKMLILKTMLSTDRDIIIMDEIDAGLDVESQQIFKELEQKLLADAEKTVIKISHIDKGKRGYNKLIQL